MKQTWLTAALLFACASVFSQAPQLQVVKNGKIKKRISQGTYIMLTDKDGNEYIGPFMVQNDSNLVIGDVSVKISDMQELRLFRKKRKEPFNWTYFGYTTAGVALSTAGMSLSKWETFPRAALYSSVLGYSQYAWNLLKKISLKKKRFRSGKNRKLRIWSLDIYNRPLKPLAPF